MNGKLAVLLSRSKKPKQIAQTVLDASPMNLAWKALMSLVVVVVVIAYFAGGLHDSCPYSASTDNSTHI
jgi:hypothetical protein